MHTTTRILLVLMLPALLAGCGRENQSSSGKVELLYWPSTNPYEIELAERLVEEWNRAHPDTVVKMQPLPEGRSGEEVLIIAAAGQTTPDICSNVPPVIVPLLAKANALVPLDSFADGRRYMQDRLPEGMAVNFINRDGKLYQVPWKGNPIMIQYNTGLLREAGIDSLPRTWSEWNRAAEAVTVDRDGDGRLDQWMANVQVESEWRRRLFDVYAFYIAATNGGTLLEEGQVAFDNPTMVDVLKLFRTGFEEGWYPKSIFAGDLFLQNRLAAIVTGPWNIAHTEKRKPEGFEYTFGPIPLPDDHEGEEWTFGDPKSIGIFSTSEHPEAAWAFVKFITSPEADKLLLEITNQLPLRRDLLGDSLYAGYFDANPLMRVFAERVPFTVGFDQHPALQEVFDAVNTAFDACCINLAIPAEEAVERAAERSRHILAMRK